MGADGISPIVLWDLKKPKGENNQLCLCKEKLISTRTGAFK